MYAVLRELEVSCVAPNDDVFFASRKQQAKSSADVKTVEEDSSVDPLELEHKVLSSLGGSLQSLYKKIPVNNDIAVDELVDESHSLREVMQGLLTLEISKFVIMLPGDRVKRNI
jgi:hypothetical protein